MNQTLIQTVNREVYRRFPEVKGKKPKVQIRTKPRTRPISPTPVYSFTYRGKATTSTNKTMPYQVRVLVNERGKILKITMSH